MTLSLNDVGLAVGVIIAGLLSSCGGGSAPPPTGAGQVTRQAAVATQTPAPTSLATFTSAPTVAPSVTLTPTPTRTPVPTFSPTPTITQTPTPHPLAGYTIRGLRARVYGGGNIEITHAVTETESFAKYLIRYPSDDLTITAMMNVPKGEGPFPVVILNHGYIPPSRFWSGADTWRAADFLASQGYLTISPDFRGWGGSDKGDNFFRTGLVIDILNLISSLSSLPQAEAGRVGMWGHSMGAGATTKAITIDPRIRAAVIYGPVSADDEDVLGRWGPGSGGGPDDSLTRAYREASSDQEFLQLTSPINYFEWVVAPVQIHQGTADQTTPPSWAEAIRDALQSAGKEVEYFNYAGAGHAFQGENWDLFMQRVTDFFDRTLKGGLGDSGS
jgi:dipeptidyl aminopeptidase/acylaminoacyl peptidase